MYISIFHIIALVPMHQPAALSVCISKILLASASLQVVIWPIVIEPSWSKVDTVAIWLLNLLIQRSILIRANTLEYQSPLLT